MMEQDDPSDLEADTYASTTEGGEVDDNPETAPSQDGKEVTLPLWKRTSFRVLLALTGLALVVIIILIPTVFVNKGDEYKGPYYQDTNFDGLDSYSASCDDCSDIHYGSHVKLSADGNRMIFTSLRNEGTVEVWDYDETTNEWVQHSLLFPHDVLNIGGHHHERNLHENGTNIVDLDINEDGSRLIISRETIYQPSYQKEVVVGVYEDLNDEGWRQVGQLLDAFAANLTRVLVNGTEPMKAYGWGEVVKMSSDGNVIAVSAPNVDYYDPSYIPDEYYAWRYSNGMVQAFELDANDDTWVPFGQTLFGKNDDDHLGRKMALSGDGQRLVIATEIGEDSSATTDVYQMRNGSWDYNLFGHDSIFIYHASDDSDVFALSRDGMVLAVAESDNSPSAYSDKPYQGAVEIYMWNEWDEEYDRVDKLWGDQAFQHFGTSIAIADDYTIVVGSTNSYDKYFPNGDRIDVFKRNNVTLEWDRVGPSFGWNAKDGWNAVAISANGSRVVAGSKGYNSKDHVDFGGVFVYDLTEA